MAWQNLWHGLSARAGHVLGEMWLALRRERVPRLALLTFLVALAGAVAVYLAEGASESGYTSLLDGLWWAIVTMSTTGYGDLVPRTAAGRIVGILLIFGGMGILSLFTATIASMFVAARIKKERGLEGVKGKGHILLCGWNYHAERVIEGLAQGAGKRPEMVLVNELSEEAAGDLLLRYRALNLRFVRGDFSNESVLQRAGVSAAAAAILLADAASGTSTRIDERTILACLAIKTMRPDVKVCAELLDAHNEPHLRRANADDIVISGEYSGFLLAAAAVSPGLPQVVRELLTIGPGCAIRRVRIPPEFVNHTFGELAGHLRRHEGALLIGIVTEEKGVAMEDILAGEYSSIDAFIRRQFSEAGKEHLAAQVGRVRVLVNPSDDYPIDKEDWAVVIARTER